MILLHAHEAAGRPPILFNPDQITSFLPARGGQPVRIYTPDCVDDNPIPVAETSAQVLTLIAEHHRRFSKGISTDAAVALIFWDSVANEPREVEVMELDEFLAEELRLQ